MKSLLLEIQKLSLRISSKVELKKTDIFELFNRTPKMEILPIKNLRSRPSPLDAEKRSLSYAQSTVRGKYPKREPLLVWKVNKPDGSYYYSVRDGNTTFQMLKNQGWSHVPVHVDREISEDELTPVPKHVSKS